VFAIKDSTSIGSFWVKNMMQIIEKFRALNQEIRKCKKCRLWKTRMHALPGEGRVSSTLVLVAQAPGYTEDREGRMFIGPSGKKLDDIFTRIGVDREEMFMTNILRCVLPKGRRPRQDEIEACTPYLDREIDLIKPKIISTLGYFAARYIFKKYDIKSELRFPEVCGKVFSSNDKTILPLRHPAALLYDNSLHRKMVNNYSKSRKLLDSV
jgi:uracil-DNA glycosylase family 4